ncbi:DNA-binding protein [Enterocloster clostridioformis]|uniref:helix-turn-helix domain-containing protein n=1 Tax=Enterocloster clostridioformis TaxID=1531 RepID=UPI00080C3824|nr:helix-turn-helix domain-containing protein [Enterocloster clostridioformis]ANU47038.1 DNA-binding protein [Lachnoclostridium sp. YL32]NDO32616.1 helix-turn-helix domain-containing protein [Enterocloster clostridioformis]OXE62881.1 DNA-binding protein [Enterocloster clostridioformis]QQQ98249.1 helix-turn-helix domain-containing protein [Enterocloster clostridioformis]
MNNPNADNAVSEDFKKYSVAEIADMLGLGKTKTRELLQSKILPVTKLGRDYFTSPKALQDFMKKILVKNSQLNRLRLSQTLYRTIIILQQIYGFL